MPRKSRTVASALAGLLLLSLLLPVGFMATAQMSNWTTVVSIKDLTGNALLRQGDPLLAGHTYNATIKVTVPLSQNISKFDVSLNSAVVKNASQFWYLLTPAYPGFDKAAWTPSLRTVGFDQVQGEFELSAIFKIPVNLTVAASGGVTLHFAESSFALVTLTVTGEPVGTYAGEVTETVSDQSIQTFLTTYQERSTMITSGQVSASYSKLLDGALGLSQSMYKEGLTDQATALLDGFGPSTLPTPPSTSYVTYMVAGIVLLAVLAASLAIVYVRGRGKAGYSEGVMNQISRELASLEIIAGRYDKALADQLKGLREKLSEAS